MKMLTPLVSLLLLVACGDDDGGATCSDLCRTAVDCGFPIPDCESSCATMTTQSQRDCVVGASSCMLASECFNDGADAGPTDSGGRDFGGPCRCEGSINGDAYDVFCGQVFCADGLQRMCSNTAVVSETGETCGGGSCVDQGDSGCGDTMNCCDIPSGTPVCMNESCCQLNGPATASSTCCFVYLEDGDTSCCTTTGALSCE